MDGHLLSKTRNQPTLFHYEIPFIFPDPGILSSNVTITFMLYITFRVIDIYIYRFRINKYI